MYELYFPEQAIIVITQEKIMEALGKIINAAVLTACGVGVMYFGLAMYGVAMYVGDNTLAAAMCVVAMYVVLGAFLWGWVKANVTQRN